MTKTILFGLTLFLFSCNSNGKPSNSVNHTIKESNSQTFPIKRLIEREFCLVYGLNRTEFDSCKLSEEIMNWWNK